ncbi:MAG TPA: nucleoside-diphosphate sugar epimerase/dehydratase [Tepidisphaeraceae bacterium]|nr:nucleoside-diphosphate sugar epimerase/dehydratase [Tepidisphaeraceae bacterium]
MSRLDGPSGLMAPLRATHPQARGSRAIELTDLLGRPAVNLDTPELQRFLAGKRVMVTGAGGSIGSEICRQMMRFCPSRVLLVERAENNLFEIDRELRERWVGADIKPCIADVCDGRRINQIFQTHKPQVVFHCAAHKHVPMMEHNPCEAIKNNIFGTKAVADAALAAGTAAFVLISTDKAVNPSSVMGASKRVAEMYIQSLNARIHAQGGALGTRFLAVRFGNVLGSSGSVVPIFQKQIEAGGPVTVTHADMRRYFMTIPEASQLVMQAGAIGKGGEIFVLDMGQSVRILDMARELIRRNGLVPDQDILIQFTGVRPGEKLYEELCTDDEQTRPTAHEKIRVWQLSPADPAEVSRGLEMLAQAAEAGDRQAVAALRRCVPEFHPDGKPAVGSPPTHGLRLVPADAQAA